MRKSHVAKGKHAKELRAWAEAKGIAPGEDLFFIAQCLSFLIYDTHYSKISLALASPSSRFALRKLKSAIVFLDQSFFKHVDS